jgi:DNA-binding response OmpR family regulator
VTGDPHEVFSLMEASDPQLVLLDLMLPGTDGIKLMQEILEMADVPVIFLSAYGQEEYVTRAFDLGAVDYIVKPFAPMELAARIRAALRKSWSVQQSAEPYLLRDLTIDYAQRSVTVAGRPVELTPIEYRLLYELSVNAGRVLTHDYLLRRIWGPEYLGYSQPVRSFVKKLRHKLGDDSNSPKYIFTQPRVGYRMGKGE